MKTQVLRLNFLILLLFSYELHAESVDSLKAKEVAISHFLGQNPNARISGLTIKNVLTKESNGINTLHYVNYEKGGFAIVSGDDNVVPILGYSDNGNILEGEIPPPLQDLLDEYSDYVEYVVKNKIQDAKAKSSWKQARQSTAGARLLTEDPILPMTTTKWGQSYNNDYGCGPHGSYNKFIPGGACSESICSNSYAGCVAVAFAQAMAFWKYETSPDHYFEWWEMTDKLTNSSSEKEVNAVASLVVACAELVEMDYDCSGSGASTAKMVPALNKLGYNQVSYESRTNYTDDVWVEKIKDQLRQGMPVVYRGRTTTSGHVMLFDGWSHDNYFHVNLGWNGYGDGNYYMMQSPQGYELNHMAFFNLIPDNFVKFGARFGTPIILPEPETEKWEYEYSDTQNSNGFGNHYSGESNQSSDDIFYRFKLKKKSVVEVKTCGSGLSDTYLHLLTILYGSELNKNDDDKINCSGARYSYIKDTLEMGTYYVVSEGYKSNMGEITTQIKTTEVLEKPGSTISEAFPTFVLEEDMPTATFEESRDNTGYGDYYTGASNRYAEDIFYSFELKRPAKVTISTCGSGINDTYIHLLKGNTAFLALNDDNGGCDNKRQARMEKTLSKGKYFVVAEAYKDYKGVIKLSLNATAVESGEQLDFDANSESIFNESEKVGFETKGITLSPNPSSSTINLRSENLILSWEILDYAGKIVLSGTPKDETESIDISNLPKSVWIIKVKTEKQTKVLKFVKA